MSFEDKAKVVVKLGQLNKLDDLKIIVENLEVKEVGKQLRSAVLMKVRVTNLLAVLWNIF